MYRIVDVTIGQCLTKVDETLLSYAIQLPAALIDIDVTRSRDLGSKVGPDLW